MKPLQPLFTLLVLLCLIPGMNAQDLQLTADHKTKTFEAGTYIEVITPSPGIAPCEKCSYNVLRGKLVSYQNELLTLQLYGKKEVLTQDGTTLGYRITNYTKEMMPSNFEVAKGDILSIKSIGKKKMKDHTTGQTIATCLGLLGLGHLASIPFAGENGDLLAGIGAAEVLVAVAIGVSSSPNTYVTNVKCPDRGKSSDKIWMLE